jgi:Ca2+-transporting ATPase
VLLADEIDGSTSPETLARVDVVARATPSQKLRLVEALRASGEIVAVTGDGVNDVPAIKAADVGIAMGERGTQSAREVASIVLLDDNFRTIADAVSEGRQLFVNLQMAFIYLLLVHIPLVVSAAFVPLMDNPILYLPVHIVIVELFIHPTALLAFQQSAPAGVLQAIPRNGPSHFFSRHTWLVVAGGGLFLALVLVVGFELAFEASGQLEQARSLVLAMLVMWSAAMTLGLTRTQHGIGLVVSLVSIVVVVGLIQVPAVAALLHLAPLSVVDWAIVAATGGPALGVAAMARRSLYANTAPFA